MNNCIKFLKICFFALFAVNSNAQEKIATYYNSYLEKTYEIKINNSYKEYISLDIDAFSYDLFNKKGGILINEIQYQEFLNAITKAKAKYIEWVKIAKENNVKELNKTMNINSNAQSYFKFGNKWEYDFSVNLKFTFKILERNGNIHYLLVIETGKLHTLSNQYIEAPGLALIYSSTKEIDEFTTAISKEKNSDFLNKQKKEDLFKN